MGFSDAAGLKDEELWFPHEIWASSIVELFEDPLVWALLSVAAEDVAISAVTQNDNHCHLGLAQNSLLSS